MITQWYLVFHTLNKMLGFKHTLFMKKTAGSSSGDGSASKNHRKRRSKKLTSSVQSVMSKKLVQGNNNNELIIPSSSVTSVMSNYDLLVEILLRLPVLSLILFKSVSRDWLSIIRSPDFIRRHRSENPNLDPPSGLLIQVTDVLDYGFESFDNRIPSKRSTVFSLDYIELLQSCNGLLLCNINLDMHCVYNPTNNQFKTIPSKSHSLARMAFDPTKSPHYKIIQSVSSCGPPYSIQLHIYSSETDSLSICSDRFPLTIFHGFNEGVYWHDAIHWLTRVFKKTSSHIKLDIENEHPVLTELELPETCDNESYFQSKLFESCGCLLLLGKDHAHSRQLNVFEMRNEDSEWSVKFIVNLDDITMPLPRTWRIRSCVWSIVLGEREEDSSMIIDLLNKVVQYNPVSKTVHTLTDLESIDTVSNFNGFQFIPSFAGV